MFCSWSHFLIHPRGNLSVSTCVVYSLNTFTDLTQYSEVVLDFNFLFSPFSSKQWRNHSQMLPRFCELLFVNYILEFKPEIKCLRTDAISRRTFRALLEDTCFVPLVVGDALDWKCNEVLFILLGNAVLCLCKWIMFRQICTPTWPAHRNTTAVALKK